MAAARPGGPSSVAASLAVESSAEAAQEVVSSSSCLAQDELQRVLARLLAGISRGALAGAVLRGGLHAISALLASASRSKKRRTVDLATALADTARYTAFLAALAGIQIGVDEGIAAAVGRDKSARWRGLVAGVAAGPALLLTGPKNRHFSLATYVLLRGLTLLIRVGNKQRNARRHPWLHAALAPTRIAHGDTLLMCAACSQIIHAFIMQPHTLPASYVRFIRKQGAKELHVWRGIRELAERTAAGGPRGPLRSLAGTPHHACQGPLPCEFFHPGQSCAAHPLQLFLPAFSRALSVYLPVYLLPALLVHRQQLLKAPSPILPKLLLGVLRSSLFLSSFICLAFGGACAGHHLTGRSTGRIIAASTWVGGVATLLEKKSRRLELALYVLSRSLESFGRCLLDWGWLPARCVPPRLDILMFAAGVGAITHCYSGANGVHRDVFRSKYLSVFDFVFGSTGFVEGRVKHCPSNIELVRSVSHRLLTAAGVRSRSGSYAALSAVDERVASSTSSSCCDAEAGGSSRAVQLEGEA